MNRLARSAAASFIVSALALACTQAATKGGEPTGTAGADLRVVGPIQFTALATVQLARTNVQGHIGPRFLGLGYAKGVMNQGLFSAANVGSLDYPGPLMKLFAGLGPGILRLGGGGPAGVDKNTWSPNATAPVAGEINPSELTDLQQFLVNTGWQALYGVNMLSDCSDGSEDAGVAMDGGTCALAPITAAGDEAQAAADALQGTLYGFEIGNEPEVYALKGEGNGMLSTESDFETAWGNLYRSMHVQAPGAAFTGPATSGGFGLGSGDPIVKYVTPFASDEKGNIALLTQHYYRDVGNMPAPNTLEQLLAPDPNVVPALQRLSTIATSDGVPYSIAEANSYSGGGVDHVSDAFGTALWALDFLFLNAQNGSSGVNFYGVGFGDGDPPIADDEQGHVCGTTGAISCWLSVDKNASPQIPEAPPVRPVYYGMKLFSMAGQGAVIGSPISWTLGERPNLTAYAVDQGEGTTSIVLINKDPTKTGDVTLELGEQASSATITLLQDSVGQDSNGLNDSAGPFTISGASIGPDGSWAPQASKAVPIVDGNTIYVLVPPATAALVTEKAVCTTPQECCAERGGVYRDGRCFLRKPFPFAN